jgi:hypothetical protein
MSARIDPAKRPPRSRSELRSDSKTLRYELENLVGIADEYSPSWRTTGHDDVRSNAYVEAFAVHCRALIFFLYGHLDEITASAGTERFSMLRSNDIIAWDFYPSWEKVCPPPTDELVEAKWRADKHVAHLTVERREVNQSGSPKESVWGLASAASGICTGMKVFLDGAPAECLDERELDRMKNAISECLRLAPSPRAPTAPPPSGGADRAAARCAQATTDSAVTGSPQPRFDTHGRTG